MAKPPSSPPHSDLDGVHEDEKPNVEAARQAGETTANMKLARDEAKGRPPHADEEGRDDRS